MDFKFSVEGGNFTKAGHASSEIKKMLKQLNLDTKVIKRAVVALYEAEVNIVAHAYKGEMVIDIDPERILVEVKDEGPGIRDISLAMQEGYSTASEKVREMGFGAGMGLPNIKKNTDIMKLESEVDKGTHLSFSIFFKSL